MMAKSVGLGLVLLAATTLQVSCSRHRQPSSPAVSSAVSEAAGSPATVPATAPTAAAAADVLAPVVPSGPRVELTGDHAVLTVELAPPPVVPGATTLTLEVRGTDGFHVNELYPTAVDLQATNATTRTQLRRGDAVQISQQLASFRVPVQVTGPGATVRGTARFAVCSEENCIPQERQFAVALPQ